MKDIEGLAFKAVDLWLNLELSKHRNRADYDRITAFVRKRFGAEKENPLLVTLCLLEMSLLEDALKGRDLSLEERDRVVREILEDLARRFPAVAEEAERILSEVDERIKEFIRLSRRLRQERERPDSGEAGG